MVLGAERVREETLEVYKRRFGVELLEGYGATEASPLISVNIPGIKRIVVINEIPVLGSGKTDYVILQRMAAERFAEAKAA